MCCFIISDTVIIMATLRAWKYLFCDIVGDPEYRRRLSGLRDLAFLEIVGRRTSWILGSSESTRGTLYIQYGEEAHYVSYRLRGDEVLLFDPSYPDGTYAGMVQDKITLIKRAFDGKAVVFDDTYRAPQRNPNDTFCQTWSLAYFMTERDKFHLSSYRGELESPRIMCYQICRSLMDGPKFREIVENNWGKLYDWQVQAISSNLVDVDEPVFNNADSFLRYCNMLTPRTFFGIFVT